MLFPGLTRVVLRRSLLVTEVETTLLPRTTDSLVVPNYQSIWGKHLNERKGSLLVINTSDLKISLILLNHLKVVLI